MPRVLIIRFSSIGDIVLTSPVVRCLKQQVKDIEVHYLTKKTFFEIIEHSPYIDKKIYFNNNLKELTKQLKKEKYDFIIDLHNNLRTAYIKRHLGVKSYSFNKLNIEKWLLVNLRINRLPHVHIVDRYMETVQHLGVNNDGKGLEYFLPPTLVDEYHDKPLPGFPYEQQQTYITFAIGAKHFTKQLPAAKIISICKKLNLPVVLLGGKEDKQKGDEIVAGVNNKSDVFNACGLYTIHQSALIIKNAKKIITHDTGLMHIAAAFKKEIISVWGNTVPGFGMSPYYGNYEVANSMFEVDSLSCRPCTKIGYSECPKGHFRCMKEQDDEGIARMANRIVN